MVSNYNQHSRSVNSSSINSKKMGGLNLDDHNSINSRDWNLKNKNELRLMNNV